MKVSPTILSFTAKKAHAENTSIKEAALALGLLTEAQFDQWVDPKSMISKA